MSESRKFLKRHFAFLLPVYNAYLARRYRGRSVNSIFEGIYRQEGWQGVESVSGQGSDLEQTAVIRKAIPALIEDLGIDSILDIPCGDLLWIKDVALGVPTYVGADIVEDLVEENRQRFAGTGRDFVRLDLTRDELPTVDLILCRDCLVHLSLDLVHAALERIKASGSGYLLTTTFPEARSNVDVQTGCWRKLNLQAAPFGLPEPDLLINEGCTEGPAFVDKSLGLWRIDQIP